MSMKYLGESFDLHTGGVDNVFPHHEDEIAQSEAATGRPFVKYWMHCAHLIVDGRKMSKSLGNFHTLRDVLKRGYTGREIRFALIGAHYRQYLNFTFDALDGARAALGRLDEFRDRLNEASRACGGSPAAGEPPGKPPAWLEAGEAAFRRALDEDLNMSEGLKALFEIVREGNKAMDGGGLSPGEATAVLGKLDQLDQVLGFMARDEECPDPETLELLGRREQARKAKDWSEADAIRDGLLQRGWIVKDTPTGPKLKRK
jgi:cysteinyl-tRNA synthetase